MVKIRPNEVSKSALRLDIKFCYSINFYCLYKQLIILINKL